ncbi:MAG TPA: tRNA (guanine(46)-N(7))-methyltransferase TrmB, partial [Sphingomonadales bacterium]|nr:tRNA (guanine(46)-N(7))-methyltransferase TrmB [Sphingomonadales bacterium]
VWLEIGFGKGEHLAAQAKSHPNIGFIGCEPYINGIAALLTRVCGENLANVRLYPDDARHVLAALATQSVGRVFLLHPDPWPKRRHAKRRFVNPENLDALARVMKTGAELRISSDHPSLVAWTLAHLLNRPDFTWTAERAGDWQAPPADWPETRFAAKARARRAAAVFLTFKKA